MTTQFSKKFLARIAAYPETVQAQLCTQIDQSAIQEVTRLLHGKSLTDEAAITEVLDRSYVLDAFLGRMIGSNAFRVQITEILEDLDSLDPVRVARAVSDVIAPLSDPDQPYIYKLHEASSSDAGTDIEGLCAVLDLYQELTRFSGDGEQLFCRLILAEIAPFLPMLAEQFGATGVPTSGDALPEGMTKARAERVVKALLSMCSVAPLSAEASFDLKRAGDILNRLDTDPNRVEDRVDPVHVLLPDGQDAASVAWWSAQQKAGLIDQIWTQAEAVTDGAPHIALQTSIHPSQIGLALLLRVARHGANVRISTIQSDRSWIGDIVGYPDEDRTLTDIGVLHSGTNDPLDLNLGLVWMDHAIPEGAVSPRQVSLETCYAVLVCLEEGVDLTAYKNYDSCRVFRSLDDFLASFEGPASPLVLQKPVIFFNAHTPDWPRYIIASVENHWRNAGLYATAPAFVKMDSQNGHLRLSPEGDFGFGHIAAAGLLSMPLSQALVLCRAEGRQAEMLRQGLALEETGVIVQHIAHQDGLPQKACEKMTRALSATPFAPDVQSAIFLYSEVDFVSVASVLQDNLEAHWPIFGRVSRCARNATGPIEAMQVFLKRPGLEQAQGILSDLAQYQSFDPNTAEFEEFLLRLTADSALLLELEATETVFAFDLAVQCGRVDEIAHNLMTFALELCHKDKDIILPLFSVLAVGLSREDFMYALASCSCDMTLSNRKKFRIGDVHQRFGSPISLLHYFVQLGRADAEMTLDPNLQRKFSSILSSFDTGYLKNQIGHTRFAGIESEVNVDKAFQAALRAGDREEALRVLSQPHKLQKLDILKWADGLRAYSNELRQMALPVERIAHPDVFNLHVRRILGAVFSDLSLLSRMQKNALLDDQSGVSVIARHILGDNGPLNQFLEDRFAGSSAPPLKIEGDGIVNVFAHAVEGASKTIRRKTNARAPLVSVIVSAYNPDIELLEYSIRSIVNQTYGHVEIFIIDDASEGQNAADIAVLADRFAPYVQVLRMLTNSGPYVGRNRAIAQARGEFIAIQDADDWSHPHRFALQVAAFDANPLVQVVTGRHIRVDWAGKVQMEAGFDITGDGSMTSMFRRTVFEQAGGFAGVRSRGDVEMRERVRSYYGPFALCELDTPLMLCLADSHTLSQQTKGDKYEFLQLFRRNISMRRDLRLQQRRGVPLNAHTIIQVPNPLRAPADMVDAYAVDQSPSQSTT